MADEPVAEPSDTPESDTLVSTDQLADALRDRDQYYDRWMRKAAEFETIANGSSANGGNKPTRRLSTC